MRSRSLPMSASLSAPAFAIPFCQSDAKCVADVLVGSGSGHVVADLGDKPRRISTDRDAGTVAGGLAGLFVCHVMRSADGEANLGSATSGPRLQLLM